MHYSLIDGLPGLSKISLQPGQVVREHGHNVPAVLHDADRTQPRNDCSHPYPIDAKIGQELQEVIGFEQFAHVADGQERFLDIAIKGRDNVPCQFVWRHVSDLTLGQSIPMPAVHQVVQDGIRSIPADPIGTLPIHRPAIHPADGVRHFSDL